MNDLVETVKAGLDWRVLAPLLIVLAACILIALERLWPFERGQPLLRAGFFDDLVLYTLAQSYLVGLPIAALIAWLDRVTGASTYGVVAPLAVWQQLALFVITHDLYIYAFPRAQHRFPLLWRLHEAHHSSKALDWLAGSRSHALEIVINQTVEFLPMVLLGARPEVVLMKGVVDAAWGMFIHANLDVRLGVLGFVVNGPEQHRWHHAREYRGDGVNFGTKLAVWDHLFGTAYRTNDKPPGYGLDEAYPEGYWRQTLHAFRRRGTRG
jgi:sterol desaturase/sphingolipid hydroxylase (fatty acid hydroxylase superfamily)